MNRIDEREKESSCRNQRWNYVDECRDRGSKKIRGESEENVDDCEFHTDEESNLCVAKRDKEFTPTGINLICVHVIHVSVLAYSCLLSCLIRFPADKFG